MPCRSGCGFALHRSEIISIAAHPESECGAEFYPTTGEKRVLSPNSTGPGELAAKPPADAGVRE